MPAIDGIIFDLDGTLVDSGLDFELMRRQMRLPSGVPLLETIDELSPADRQRCNEILHRHELAGAARAELMPGVETFLDRLAERGLRRAVVTRNSRTLTLPLLQRLGLDFDPVLSRDDGPVKPDPASIWEICRVWGTLANRVVVMGDYRFDLELARRAGAKSVFYLGARSREPLPDWAGMADFVLASFSEPDGFFAWLDRQSA
jgi:HAD superfamily hydrolase (TIGR01509 family)